MTGEMILESCKYEDSGQEKFEFIEMMEKIYSIPTSSCKEVIKS